MKQDQRYMTYDDNFDVQTIHHLALWAYLTDRTTVKRRLYQTNVRLTKKLSEGWTYDLLYLAGLLKEKLETVYGLTTDESRQAIDQYPLEHRSFWNSLREDNISAKAHIVFCHYNQIPVSSEIDLLPKKLVRPDCISDDEVLDCPDADGFIPAGDEFLQKKNQ